MVDDYLFYQGFARMPQVKVQIRVWSSGTESASGQVYGGQAYGPNDLSLESCSAEKDGNQVRLDFGGKARKYPRAQIVLPVELARQIAKVILAETDGLWEKWEAKFFEV